MTDAKEEVQAEAVAEEVQEEVEEEVADEGDDGEEEEAPSTSKAPAGPTKLGFKTFDSGKQAVEYFKQLMASSPPDIDFNEYEYRVLLDLLLKGHPNAASKIGPGLKAFQVRRYPGAQADAKAFYAVRKDGSSEDFSYLKCCQALFPDDVQGTKRHRSESDHGARKGGPGGRDGGRGRGGRSPGGRGGRGGRFGRGRGRR